MNPKIKELWIKAADLESDDSWESQTKFMERFAELIVRECAVVCDTIGKEARKEYKLKYNPWDDGRADGAWQCEETIKEHFGVE